MGEEGETPNAGEATSDGSVALGSCFRRHFDCLVDNPAGL